MVALNTQELALRLGISRRTLENWRGLGLGPPFYKLGSRVVYDPEAIEKWLNKCRVGEGKLPESEGEAA